MLANVYLRNVLRLLIVFLAHWPVSTLQRSVKWDNLDVILPYRYLLGEMWGSGRIPFWNPYQQMGYPMYADLQSPTWYPETMIVGLLGGYTNYTIHILLILYAFLGSIGFSKLAESYGLDKKWSYLAGLVYVLSGFWVGHGQALFVWVSAAWIPFLWWSFRRFLERPDLSGMALVAFFAYLQMTGGYPTMTLFFIYLAILLYIIRILEVWRERSVLSELMTYSTGLLLVLMAMGLGQGWSVLEVKDYVSRLSGLSDRYLFEHPFSIPSFISFLYPLATVGNADLFETDLSMRNAFLGSITLIGLTRIGEVWKRKDMRVLIFISLFFVLGALGDLLPFRAWMAQWMPGMDLFRMPAYLMYIPLMVLLLSSMLGWSELIKSNITKRWIVLWIAIHLLVLIISLFWGGNGIMEEKGTAHLLFWSALAAVVFTFAFFMAFQFGNRILVLVFILVEMMGQAWIMDRHTLYHTNAASEVHAHFREIPDSFHVVRNITIGESTDKRYERRPGLWRNTAIYTKELSKDGFSSFWFRSINDTLESEGPLMRSLWFDYPGELSLRSFEPGKLVLNTSNSKDADLVIHQAWFPHWKAEMDGKEIGIDKTGSFQQIHLPAGKHELRLLFVHPMMITFWLVGLFLWLISGIICLKHWKSNT